MIDRLLSYVAPHLCSSCGEIGGILCDSCKYDIGQVDLLHCVACGRGLAVNGVCRQCRVPYVKAWCVGLHAENLRQLIKQYKFDYARAAAPVLADLLLARVSELPTNTVIIPLPTAGAHIRQRGYDHIDLVAKRFAKKRRLKLSAVIERTGSDKQRGANRSQRIAQAKIAFRVRVALDPTVPYLLIDDVVTTGASLKYATLALQAAGAREIWVAVIARQPLD
jgi:ComF family protein